MRGLAAFNPAARRKAQPRVKHGATEGGWENQDKTLQHQFGNPRKSISINRPITPQTQPPTKSLRLRQSVNHVCSANSG
jgi:hypothetical protein